MLDFPPRFDDFVFFLDRISIGLALVRLWSSFFIFLFLCRSFVCSLGSETALTRRFPCDLPSQYKSAVTTNNATNNCIAFIKTVSINQLIQYVLLLVIINDLYMFVSAGASKVADTRHVHTRGVASSTAALRVYNLPQ